MTMICVSGCMFLLVPAHPGCPGQNAESRKMVVCVCWSCFEFDRVLEWLDSLMARASD